MEVTWLEQAVKSGDVPRLVDRNTACLILRELGGNITEFFLGHERRAQLFDTLDINKFVTGGV